MINRDEINLEESRSIIEDNPPRPDPRCQGVLLGSPTCRLASLWGPPGSRFVVRWFATASIIQSMLLLKVGSYQGSRFDVAMDSWAHRTPSAPYKRTPIPPPEGDPHH